MELKFDNTWSVKNYMYLTGTVCTKRHSCRFVPIEKECFKLLMYILNYGYKVDICVASNVKILVANITTPRITDLL